MISLAGMALVAAGWPLEGYLQAVVLQVGSVIALLGPITFIERRLLHKVEQAQRSVRGSVAKVSDELKALRQEERGYRANHTLDILVSAIDQPRDGGRPRAMVLLVDGGRLRPERWTAGWSQEELEPDYPQDYASVVAQARSAATVVTEGQWTAADLPTDQVEGTGVLLIDAVEDLGSRSEQMAKTAEYVASNLAHLFVDV